MSSHTVLAVAGSLRRGSLNRRLLEAAVICAPAGLCVRVYPTLGGLPLFNEDLEAAAFGHGPVRALVDEVAGAAALLIATPEYNHSVPGVLKNAIDWLSRPASGGPLARKPVALAGASSGRWGTRLAQAALRQTLFAAEAQVLAGPALYLAEAQRAFDAAGNLTDEAVGAALREILLALEVALTSSRGT